MMIMAKAALGKYSPGIMLSHAFVISARLISEYL
jgi:hypothetical protein